MTSIKDLKQILYNSCADYLEKRIKNVQNAINEAKDSANDETKSSAGDKHETGRAMMQLDQEKNVRQLDEAVKLRQVLEKIRPGISKKVTLGSLVITNKNAFYISIPAGEIIVDKTSYFAVSPTSPIGKALLGVEENSEIEFNDQVYKIKTIL